MTQIDDAPWVRMAELYGPDEAEEIEYSCPVCGEEQPEDLCFNNYGEIIGCNCCCHFKSAYEFMSQKRAEERSEWK